MLDLDQVAMTATLRHRYLHTDGEMNTPSQGNCQLLAGGGHVVGWGFRPYFSVYASSPEGTLGAPLMLDGRFPQGAASYRTFLFDWRGNPPVSEMALVVRPAGGSGATDRLGELERSDRGGGLEGQRRAVALSIAAACNRAEGRFETAIEFVGDGASYFDVDAIDVKGQVIGRTLPVPIT